MQKSMINKKIGLIFLLLLFVNITFSQENFLPGYIIKTNGDTLKGFIDYRNWGTNPGIIKFKQEKITSEFTPFDIIEFGVHDEIYVSGTVELETSPFRTNELDDNPKINTKIKTVFLQSLIIGKKSLYYHKVSFGKEDYYIKNDTTFELLVYKRYLTTFDGKTGIKENKRYQRQLLLYLIDCPQIQVKLENTSYSLNSLINLFKYYYDCTKSNIKFSKSEENIEFKIGILSGLTLTSLKLNGYIKELFPFLITSLDPSLGLSVEIIFPGNQRKWSLKNELFYSSYKFTEHNEEIINTNEYFLYTLSIEYSHIKLNNLLRYKNSFNRFDFFLNGGISNGFLLTENNYMKLEHKSLDDESFIERKPLIGVRKLEISSLIGFGLIYKKFSFESRFERTRNMSIYSSLNQFHILLGYRF